jgi:hypothetical protein
LLRSTTNNSTGKRARAANRPPKPQPTMRTRGRRLAQLTTGRLSLGTSHYPRSASSVRRGAEWLRGFVRHPHPWSPNCRR